MKRFFTPIFILILCMGSAMAQPLFVTNTLESVKEFSEKPRSYGARVGTNFATLFGDTYSGLGFRSGLVLGGYVQVPLNDNFNLQAEANISLEGAKDRSFRLSQETSSIYEQTLTYNYLQLPVIASYSLGNDISLQAGLQMGVKLAAKESRFLKEGSHTEDIGFVGTRNYTNRIKVLYPSVVIGAAYPLPFLEGLSAEARIQTSVFDNVKRNATGSDGTHPFVFQLALRYEIVGE